MVRTQKNVQRALQEMIANLDRATELLDNGWTDANGFSGPAQPDEYVRRAKACVLYLATGGAMTDRVRDDFELIKNTTQGKRKEWMKVVSAALIAKGAIDKQTETATRTAAQLRVIKQTMQQLRDMPENDRRAALDAQWPALGGGDRKGMACVLNLLGSDEASDEVLELLDELRNTAQGRINQIAWMSTVKGCQDALSKLKDQERDDTINAQGQQLAQLGPMLQAWQGGMLQIAPASAALPIDDGLLDEVEEPPCKKRRADAQPEQADSEVDAATMAQEVKVVAPGTQYVQLAPSLMVVEEETIIPEVHHLGGVAMQCPFRVFSQSHGTGPMYDKIIAVPDTPVGFFLEVLDFAGPYQAEVTVRTEAGTIRTVKISAEVGPQDRILDGQPELRGMQEQEVGPQDRILDGQPELRGVQEVVEFRLPHGGAAVTRQIAGATVSRFSLLFAAHPHAWTGQIDNGVLSVTFTSPGITGLSTCTLRMKMAAADKAVDVKLEGVQESKVRRVQAAAERPAKKAKTSAEPAEPEPAQLEAGYDMDDMDGC